MSIGPCNTQIQTDDQVSFDGIETLLARLTHSTLVSFNAHLGALVKYDNYDNDVDCDECNTIKEIE